MACHLNWSGWLTTRTKERTAASKLFWCEDRSVTNLPAVLVPLSPGRRLYYEETHDRGDKWYTVDTAVAARGPGCHLGFIPRVTYRCRTRQQNWQPSPRKSSSTSIKVCWSGGRAVERRTTNRLGGSSITPAAVSKLGQFRSLHIAYIFRKRY